MSKLTEKNTSYILGPIGPHAGYGVLLIAVVLVAVFSLNPQVPASKLAWLENWVEGFRLPINQAGAVTTADDAFFFLATSREGDHDEVSDLLPGIGPAVMTAHGVGGQGFLDSDPFGFDAALSATAPLADKIDATIRDDIRCLALNMYFEARNESELGKLAVSQVVLNRVSDKRFPNTICGVIQQGGEDERHRCQFSWWCDGRSDIPRESRAWSSSVAFAKDIYFGLYDDPTKGALWYHADYVKPSWRKSLDLGPKIGRHLFYGDGDEFVAAHAPVEMSPVSKPDAPSVIDRLTSYVATLLTGS